MIENINFEYSTQIELLIMPEYGRNVQDLVRHCKTIEEPRYRQSFAEGIIDLMQIMTPYNKNLDEHRKKMWHHFFRIAKYDIEVIPPAGVIPTPDKDVLKPTKIEYPPNNEKFRHYGNYINGLIKKAVELEDSKKKLEFACLIGSFMKTAYVGWSKDQHITDEIIKSDLKTLSKGQLILPDEVVLVAATSSTQHRADKKPTQLAKNKNKQNFKKKAKNKNKQRY